LTRMALVFSAIGLFFGATSVAQARSAASSCPGVVKSIYVKRHATRSLERKMGHTPSRSNFNASRVKSCAYAKWVRGFWQYMNDKRADEYRQWKKQQPEISSSWLTNAFMCIHHYEGAWNANTGNGYYGGLQMDSGFQGTYGPDFVARWGTADNWPVWAQLAAAERAYSSRGFSPWPNTARACSLL
jgi:transglycosylase-like protein